MANRDDDHELGLLHDLATMTRRGRRRDFLRWMAGASLVPIIGGCTTNDVGVLADDAAGANGGTCSTIPEETAGPYPGDGSNGVNALTTSGIVRSNITSSFGSYTGTAAGIPLTIQLTMVDTANSCAPLAGFAVYLWHCDRDGKYSLYSSGITNQNYLRGVQEVGDDGTVTFTSIFPACYAGRWPHIHFEVYASLADVTSSANKIATSQLALPKATCDVVYATTGYGASVTNLAQTSLASDNVFSDGSTLQLANMSGSASAGYTAALTVGVDV